MRGHETITVSVIIPAYNAAPYIGEAMASIQSQTLHQWEMLVVDDGSTDDTPYIVQKAAQADPRITLIQQKNTGEAMARATGLAQSNGEFIYFLDADDIALPDALEHLVNILHITPDAIAAYGSYVRINSAGALIYPQGRVLDTLPRPQGSILRSILKQPLFAMGTVLVRRAHITPEDITIDTDHAEDWVMWVRLAIKGKFVYAGKKPLVKYRIHSGNQTQNQPDSAKHLQTIETVFSMPALRSMFSTKELNILYAHRQAFSFFSLACKKLRTREYPAAAELFKRSIHTAYWRRPSAWLLYIFATIGWLPGRIKRHLG